MTPAHQVDGIGVDSYKEDVHGSSWPKWMCTDVRFCEDYWGDGGIEVRVDGCYDVVNTDDVTSSPWVDSIKEGISGGVMMSTMHHTSTQVHHRTRLEMTNVSMTDGISLDAFIISFKEQASEFGVQK